MVIVHKRKNPREKLKNALLPLLAFVMAGSGLAHGVSSENDDRFTTQVESDSGESKQKTQAWDRTGAISQPKSVATSEENESININVDGNTLSTSWERFSTSPEFQDVETRVDDQTQRISDLEDLVDQLEIDDEMWDDLPPSPGDWNKTGTSGASVNWSPAISTQTSDFVQTREKDEVYQRTVEVYEENLLTGAQRLTDTYTENEVRKVVESRPIDVSRYATGGTDGWSGWSWYGSVYSCGSWSPARSTVNYGTRYTQYRYCKRNQERFIHYLAAGSHLQQNRQTRAATYRLSRSTTGTKYTVECRFNGWGDDTFGPRPFTSDYDNWDIWLYGNFIGKTDRINTQSSPFVANGKRYWAGQKRSNYLQGEYYVCHYKQE